MNAHYVAAYAKPSTPSSRPSSATAIATVPERSTTKMPPSVRRRRRTVADITLKPIGPDVLEQEDSHQPQTRPVLNFRTGTRRVVYVIVVVVQLQNTGVMDPGESVEDDVSMGM